MKNFDRDLIDVLGALCLFLLILFAAVNESKAETYTYDSETNCYSGYMSWDHQALYDAGYRAYQIRHYHTETDHYEYYRDDPNAAYSILNTPPDLSFCGFGHWTIDVRFAKWNVEEQLPWHWTEWYNVKNVHIFEGGIQPNPPTELTVQ